MYMCENYECCDYRTNSLESHEEYRGECHGSPSWESVEDNCCPDCGSNLVEAIFCENKNDYVPINMCRSCEDDCEGYTRTEK